MKKTIAYTIVAVVAGIMLTLTPLLSAAGPSLSFLGTDPSKPGLRISISGQDLIIEQDNPFRGVEIYAVSLIVALAGYVVTKKRIRSPPRQSAWSVPY